MPVTAIDGQVSIQDPRNPVLQEVLNHPDYRVVASFLLGWVLVSSAYCAFSSKLIRELACRGARLCMGKRAKKPVKDIEAAGSSEDENEKCSTTRVATQQEADDNASLFILNLCFALAALASFCSLLNLGGQKGNSVACTVVVAWSSMASQSVRIVGLLMLTWRLRRFGMKRLETYALWFGLLVVLGLVFALNATGTGAISVIGPSGVGICYRQYFWPVALSLSGVVIFLEVYVAVRVFVLGTTHVTTRKSLLRRLFNMEVARPMSLFALDVATVVQGAMWVDSLAQFIPFSLASLLVIGVFNYTGAREGVSFDEFPHPRRISLVTDEQRFSAQRPNSLLEPSPFLLQFMERPMSPDSNVNTVPVRPVSTRGHIDEQDGDLVLHISAASLDDQDTADVEPPHSAPANLTEMPSAPFSGSRHILPFQVQYVERLEREAAAIPTGPLPPRRDRPKVFVVIDEDDQGLSPGARRSRASIIGSDIIRTTPTTPHNKRKLSFLWSPESSVPSGYPYASPRNSHSTARTQMTAFSAYPHVERSPTVHSEHTDQHLGRQDSYLSPEEPSRRFSWRTASRHQSVMSSRTSPRDELPTVMEGSSTFRTSSVPSRPASRVQSRRLTFGQPIKPPSRRSTSITARNPVSPQALPRLSSYPSLREAISSLLSPEIPPVPPMPSPLTSPSTGLGLPEVANLSGMSNVRGPLLPPLAITSPSTSPHAAQAEENTSASQETSNVAWCDVILYTVTDSTPSALRKACSRYGCEW
ncbi:uncharacterized protein B0H18DRAFT_5181 [Fomitopsis serialis]|uniref:uncharacterized protein n=1 Tax=Fomitopsis serialis TaxID=139415 RepID=UPI0020088E1B|nr:uncharacterized protein B0H18DRAFT_5181 [Neoantrodia serialis]KAH9938153.1 hypothetical protein B0H18DRAFT_5181 [Neoantrodia serialis]